MILLSLPPPFSKADFITLAAKHELSQGISIKFDLAYKRCILQNKATQLPFLYQIANTIKPTATSHEICTHFSETIDS
jgi:hypothetical protein